MDWLQLHIDTTHAGLEPVETMLSALGIDGVVIDDETEFQDFLENNHQYWDYVDEDLTAQMAGKSRITFYLEAGEEGFAKMGEVRLALEQLKTQRDDCGSLLLTLENLKDADWENNWKQYYKPMEIGEHLVVVPQWLQEDPKVQKLLAEGRVPLILDPGLTFGTGCWTWAAAAAFCPSPPCGWGPRRPLPATLTINARTWPTKTPPSTASAGTPTPFRWATF